MQTTTTSTTLPSDLPDSQVFICHLGDDGFETLRVSIRGWERGHQRKHPEDSLGPCE